MRTKGDYEWRVVNAATEVLRDMKIALHYTVIGSIIRGVTDKVEAEPGVYWHWQDAPPTDEQLARALRRNYAHRGDSAYPPVTLFRESPGVWRYCAVPAYKTPSEWRRAQQLLASRP